MNEVQDVEWLTSTGLTEYPAALEEMTARNAAVSAGDARELVWLLEHPPLYTAGTSANEAELLSNALPVYPTGRGGKYTYHGPGQRTGYLILDLKRRVPDVRHFVCSLEGWIIRALGELGVEARRAPGRIGIWCDRPDGQEAKIGAIGIRMRRWVTMHGFAVNIDPDLGNFSGIVPCGISEYPVTSLADLGIKASMADFDGALTKAAPAFFEAIANGPG